MSALKIKHTIRLSPEISMQMADYARRKRKPQAVIVEAALASFLSADGSDRLEAATMRLAAAIRPSAGELPGLLIEALDDRRITLFTALIGHALGVEYDTAREIVFDASAERLWLVLRALDLPREKIAMIGYALSEADPRRDIDAFADALDAIMTIDAERARDALAPLRLDRDFRAAIRALNRSGEVS